MLDAARLASLPALFEEIVVQQRICDAVLQQPVVLLKYGIELIKRKRELQKAAEAYCWGDSGSKKRG